MGIVSSGVSLLGSVGVSAVVGVSSVVQGVSGVVSMVLTHCVCVFMGSMSAGISGCVCGCGRVLWLRVCLIWSVWWAL